MAKTIIPEAALEQHVAVLGKTGSGKTSTAKLCIEQVVARGARVCVLDPIKSDWWGMTSSADGKKPGLPFHILGGPRGHVPLHASAGKAIAEIVASGALPLSIIDMADFEPGGQQRFFVDFAPALLRKMRGVVYLVVEEAHLFAPKERSGLDKENMSIHWAKTLATAGRSKGIRLILLSQRVQALHNALLGSCETLIAHRLSAPADQDPVLKWLKANASAGILEMVSAQLSSLKTGAGWVCSGEAKIFQRFDFPRIHTYDNTATPTGDGDVQQVMQAPVDAEKLKAIVGEAVKEAAANDPKILKATIARLEADLRKSKVASENQKSAPDPVALAAARQEGREEGSRDGYIAGLRAVQPAADRLSTLSAGLAETAEALRLDLHRLAAAHQLLERRTSPALPAPQRRAPAAPAPRAAERPAADLSAVGSAKQRILDALAWLEAVGIDRAEKVQLALLADQSPKSSGYSNNLGALRSAGLIEYPGPAQVTLTDAGRRSANAPERPPTSEDLHRTLEIRLGAPKWRILKVLIGYYPEAIAKTALAAEAGQSASSSGYANNLGALRSLGFIDYPQPGQVAAQPALFLEAR